MSDITVYVRMSSDTYEDYDLENVEKATLDNFGFVSFYDKDDKTLGVFNRENLLCWVKDLEDDNDRGIGVTLPD